MQKESKIEISFCINIDDKLTDKELKEMEQNYKELIAYTFNKNIKNFKLNKLGE